MKSAIPALSVLATLFVWAYSAAAGSPSTLEALEPKTALSEVRASRGVVFVDLYAHW